MSGDFPLCSECFKNEGLRVEAYKLGILSDESCTNCGASSGRKLDRDGVHKLFDEFYVYGSRPAVYLPRVFTWGKNEGDDIQFEATAEEDRQTFRSILGLEVSRHAPRLFEMGYTEIRSDIEEVVRTSPQEAPESAVAKLRSALERLIAAGAGTHIETDQKLFRARISPSRPLDPAEYDSPPLDLSRAGRFACPDSQNLSAAFDIETCLIEIKPSIADIIHNRVCVATLVPVRRIRVLDLTQLDVRHDRSAFATMHGLFEPNDYSYQLTQLLAAKARAQGYEGVVYPSAMECASGHHGRWKNAVLFGAPVSGQTLKVGSINRVCIQRVNYEFSLGPLWEENVEGNYLSPYLKGWLRRAMR